MGGIKIKAELSSGKQVYTLPPNAVAQDVISLTRCSTTLYSSIKLSSFLTYGTMTTSKASLVSVTTDIESVGDSVSVIDKSL